LHSHDLNSKIAQESRKDWQEKHLFVELLF